MSLVSTQENNNNNNNDKDHQDNNNDDNNSDNNVVFQHVRVNIIPNSAKFVSTKWSNEDDDRLATAVSMYGEKYWKLVSEYVGSKTNRKFFFS